MMVWEPLSQARWEVERRCTRHCGHFCRKRTPSVQVFNPIFDGHVEKYRWRETFNTLQCGPELCGVYAEDHHRRQ